MPLVSPRYWGSRFPRQVPSQESRFSFLEHAWGEPNSNGSSSLSPFLAKNGEDKLFYLIWLVCLINIPMLLRPTFFIWQSIWVVWADLWVGQMLPVTHMSYTSHPTMKQWPQRASYSNAYLYLTYISSSSFIQQVSHPHSIPNMFD